MRAKIDNDWSIEQAADKEEIFAINKKKGVAYKIGTSGKKLNRIELLKLVENYLKLNNFLEE
ncbi:hypothetical protein SAMN02910327_00400 [Peptostreptococcaceae bacterium pGA-8]|nr:hypothetical protein SAMN02910327_00400 [Peptostreptococcaceae bacterium pGA-8]